MDVNLKRKNPIKSNSTVSRIDGLVPSAWLIFTLVTLTCLALFALRLCDHPDLMDNDQERPAAYVMDIVSNGHWIVQRDQSGAIMSKPPFSTWLTALIAMPFGRLNLFWLYLPCALATLAIAWLILAFGSIHFGRGAALLGALCYLISPIGHKQIALARTDSVFALTVFLAALIAYRTWSNGGGWTLFALAAAAATLTKGPLGVLLAVGGLGAVWWEKRSGDYQALNASPWLGIALFLLLTVGWFCLAYHQMGQALIDKMLLKELVGHAVHSDRGRWPGVRFYIPPLYFLSRFGPWSILACFGFWRIWKHPAQSIGERRFERFLFAYFFFGLLIFSLAPHQRPDHLWPLIPAAALIAGREMAFWLHPRSLVRLFGGLLVLLIFFFTMASLYTHFVRNKDQKVVSTVRVKEFADYIQQKAGRDFPLIYVEAPYTLQFYLNTMRQTVSLQEAARELSCNYPAFVVLKHPDRLKKLVNVTTYEVARGPESLTILSNCPRLERTSQPVAVPPFTVHKKSSSPESSFFLRFLVTFSLGLILFLAGRSTFRAIMLTQS